jgi:hypothetical protein
MTASLECRLDKLSLRFGQPQRHIAEAGLILRTLATTVQTPFADGLKSDTTDCRRHSELEQFCKKIHEILDAKTIDG